MIKDSGAYEGYIEMKGWRVRFQHDVADAHLFEEEFKAALSSRPRNLVDIGFGGGTLLSWARARGIDAGGLEIQPQLVAEARAQGYTVYPSLASIDEGSVDLVSCMDVFEHMSPELMRATFADVKRVLTAGGWLVLRTPNCQSPAGLIDQFGDGTHRQMLSGPILAEELRRAGFLVHEVRGARNRAAYQPGVGPWVKRGAKRIVAIPARLIVRAALGTGGSILEPSVIVLARKPANETV